MTQAKYSGTSDWFAKEMYFALCMLDADDVGANIYEVEIC